MAAIETHQALLQAEGEQNKKSFHKLDKEEFEARLSDVKQCAIPDFGVEDTSLIDDILGVRNRLFVKATSLESLHETTARNGHELEPQKKEDPVLEQQDTQQPYRPHSLWWLFYDCIAKFPKFEQLKNFINESHRLKEFQNDKMR